MFIGADQPLRPGTVKQGILLFRHICLWDVSPIHKMCSEGISHRSRRGCVTPGFWPSAEIVAAELQTSIFFVLSANVHYERCSQPARKELSSFHINSPLLPFFKVIIPRKGQVVIFTLHPLHAYSNYLWRWWLKKKKKKLVALLGRLLQREWHLHEVSDGEISLIMAAPVLWKLIIFSGLAQKSWIICGKAGFKHPILVFTDKHVLAIPGAP